MSYISDIAKYAANSNLPSTAGAISTNPWASSIQNTAKNSNWQSTAATSNIMPTTTGAGAAWGAVPTSTPTPTASTSASTTPAYGSNIANFNPNDPTQKALADAGQRWAAAQARGDQAGMQAAAALGQQIRNGAGNASYNGSAGVTTFNNTPTPTPTNGTITPASVPSGYDTIGNVGQMAQAQNGTTKSLYNMYLDALNTASNPNDPYWLQYQAQAANSANGILQDKQAQLDTARNAVDDQFFQKYLQNRQALANRGIANSGLANDSDFRLQLAKQQSLGDVYANLGTFNKSQIQADEFGKLYDKYSSALKDKADSLKGMYDSNLPYDQMTTKDMLGTLYNYDKMSVDNQQFYDKLNSDNQIEMAKLGFNYDQLNSQQKQFYDKLSQDGAIEAAKMQLQWKQYGLDVTKAMGVDENGNPTLDAQKLLEQAKQSGQDLAFKYDQLGAEVKNWTAQNQLKQDELKLSRDQFNEKAQYDQSMINKAKASASSDAAKAAIDSYKSQADNLNQRILAAYNKDGKADPALVQQYNSIMQQINTLLKGGTSGN